MSTSSLFLLCVVAFFSHENHAELKKSVEQWAVAGIGLTGRASAIDGIYSVAIKQGLFPPNMYYYKNDSDMKSLAQRPWNFSYSFEGSDLLSYENVNIVLDGIDTFSYLYINGKYISDTSNMFNQYVLNIRKYLVEKENTFVVSFDSPLENANGASFSQGYPVPPNCPDLSYQGDCHINQIRKMQASFSWDWGPSVPSVGIWRPAYIEAYNETVIRHVVVDPVLNGNYWEINVDVYFENNRRNLVTGSLQLQTTFGNKIVHTISVKPNYNLEIIYSTKFLVKEDQVGRWWPNGYGPQNLYNLTATFTSNSQEVTKKTVKFGFRTVELIQEEIGSNGLSFYLKVNDVPIYAKGSNLIPVDLLPEKGQDPATVKKLFSAAKSAHMNMLRIWGGGVYESDYLYNLADEYGILIWQDLMFACALYPVYGAFRENVNDEINYQMKRLYSHPSIVIYAGNNENEGALVDNWWGIDNEDKLRYYEDYRKLYVDTVKPVFEKVSNQRGIFLTSSPSNGKQTEKEDYLSRQPSSSYYGDVHFYDYNSDSFDPSTYPIPRFASEYGFQSLPSADSFLRDTNNPRDLNLNSNFMRYRQHHPSGNPLILNLITKQLTLPSETHTNYDLAVIYYSQIIQAYSYKIQTERYRNYRSILTSDGRGRTMGALYWQLNDVWTAPTWSSIDYYGRWKMLQYSAIKCFSPIIINGHLEQSNVLNIYVVTDHEKVKDTAIVKLYKWDSVHPIFNYSIEVDLSAGSSKLVHQDNNLSSNMANFGCSLTTCFISLSLKGAPDNFVLPAKLKDSSIISANVKVTSIIQNGKNFDIQVTSDNIALFVWLDAHSIVGQFSENGFLQIGGTKTVRFYPDTSVSLEDLKKALTVTHLKDQKYL